MLKAIMWLGGSKLLSIKREFEILQYWPAGPCPFTAATMQHMATNDSQLQLTTVPLHLPQIPHWLARGWNQASKIDRVDYATA